MEPFKHINKGNMYTIYYKYVRINAVNVFGKGNISESDRIMVELLFLCAFVMHSPGLILIAKSDIWSAQFMALGANEYRMAYGTFFWVHSFRKLHYFPCVWVQLFHRRSQEPGRHMLHELAIPDALLHQWLSTASGAASSCSTWRPGS